MYFTIILHLENSREFIIMYYLRFVKIDETNECYKVVYLDFLVLFVVLKLGQ